MTLLVLAGLALALSMQSAAARGGSGGVTVIVSGDRSPVQRIVKTQSKHHFGSRWTRTHRFGGSPVDQWRRHSGHDSSNVAVRAFQRSAAHHAGFRSHSGRDLHKPPPRAHARHALTAPRMILVAPPGARRAGGHGVVVFRGSGAHSLAGGRAPGALGGGKLIVLSSSPRFKHVVVGK
jgi:hypothetical protein